jgi:hypothetical protein
VRRLDAWLLSRPSWVKATILLLTLASMTVSALHRIPRPFLDLSRWPVLAGISQPAEYGTDTIADRYEARVVRHEVRDMYTKRLTDQTPLEAATWTKEASSPYPPATLLALAALSAAGDAAGVGLYGAICTLAVAFLALSLIYFVKTRWYLFPLLYLNFSYVAERFFSVQDGSYLVMLTLIMSALFLARRFASASVLLMATAIVTKLSPIYFARYLTAMPRRTAIAFVTILIAGLVLPYFVWDNYLYIYRYNSELKGSGSSALIAALIAIPVALLLDRADRRAGFDLEDRIGWSLVPMALFLAIKMNAIRHLLLVLLVPDKRGVRNVAAAVGLTVYALLPAGTALNSMLPIVTIALVAGLLGLQNSSTVAEKE